MTDSRVTPQAAAKEREHVALTAATYTLWRYDYRGQSSEWFDAHHPEEWHWERAERALTAAVPLLCQPLQGENRQLRAIMSDVTLLRRAIADPGRFTPRFPDESVTAWSARAVATTLAAAVPVGTGNPTQPRADD